ncbi:recombination directionality factor [Acinetobacter baumannii]|uniref:recombination directionality factor n=1 Tax=Acinetobacter calcoaceticus/baumannii complex TaxID=909768 RepID=UPI000D0EFBDE|nr:MULTISPECIES: hydrolase or metal-binding protein [Acinetobacter calcoaceticus/baumannii complex]MBD0440541.1 hydrolase or metal-binding protein [Acinetobacter baumannii]MCG9238072.1 hydrolase or metal-binding protein [Acinetobacter baumannii]MCZ3066450.1 hydrolase or metal-binding protein [Acinetobacter baumannii]MCZ3107172.1 hydrolase or metal-binding protein [Acinetobacter baumannii]MDE3319776.1 hydrolase or metal-binding protein [Acinetobacter baumannii]
MIKGLAITPPILGRISIGKVVEKNGKRLPEKDDQFTITSQIQSKEGWIKHPLDEQLRSKAPNQKLRTIPVRMIFNDPDLNLRAEYSLFDRQTGRPVCVGNGETCQRLTNQGVEQHPCPSPDLCSLAQGGNCKPYGRLHVNLDESDELGTFIFRTTGFNSIRTLAARLSYYHAASNGLLSCLPLQLTLRGKSTTQSYRTPVYYVDLTLRDGVNLQHAIQMAKDIDQQSKNSGFNQQALDQMARQGYGIARFEVNAEEGLDLVEEFYMDENQETEHSQQQVQVESKTRARAKPKPNQSEGFVQDMQKGLQGSVRAVN